MFAVIRYATILALIILSVYAYPYLNPQTISSFVKNNGAMAPLVFIVITSVRPVLFFLPSLGLTIVAGVLFGAAWGTVYVVIGGAFSTLVGFYFAKWLGRDAMKRLVEKHKLFAEIEKKSKRYGKNAVLYMRLFNLPWDIVSYWAGLSGLRFKDFYLASVIPLIPVSFLYTYFGSHVFAPTSLGFIVSLLIMFLMGAVPYIKARYNSPAGIE
ncbi:MAG TPA: TVP38/TMEM64 family protein [Candidatus Brocadiaceae bacterium]|nr:TVP38/TMEM64 family protein [Candidatus Brocadiaceae bacterium]